MEEVRGGMARVGVAHEPREGAPHGVEDRLDVPKHVHGEEAGRKPVAWPLPQRTHTPSPCQSKP